jgi:murein DD-endopeptidase MepM/ murein hydrolase activator NlpD
MNELKVGLGNYLPAQNQTEQKDLELKKACREFESIFTHHLLKAMRKTIDKCDLFHGGYGEEVYESLLDVEIAKKVSGLGPNSLADLLYQQLKTNVGTKTPGELSDDGKGNNHRLESWPLNTTVSSEFGWRIDPIAGGKRFHEGVDLAAEEGTSVHAALPGRVVFSGKQKGYGNVVVINHGNELETLYAHNRRNLVGQGELVRAGTPIAEVGSSGRSTGPHLHFEVRNGGQPMNPIEFFPVQMAETR